jgi:hypothetical protein
MKWFNSLPRLVQFILLLIPGVNWIIEIIVRLTAVIDDTSTTNILGIVLAVLVPFWGWVDLVWVLLKNKLCLTE